MGVGVAGALAAGIGPMEFGSVVVGVVEFRSMAVGLVVERPDLEGGVFGSGVFGGGVLEGGVGLVEE